MAAMAEVTHEDRLMAAGAPYELVAVEGPSGRVQVFRHAPATVPDFLRTLSAFTARPLLVYESRRWTYGELLGHAAGVARELRQHGVRKCSHVAIAMRNSPECIAAILGALSIGAVPVMLNSRSGRAELIEAVRSARSSIVLADARCAQELRQSGLSGVTIVDDAQLAALGSADFFAQLATDVAPDDPAVILCTSGSTGRPKAAVLTHRGVMTSIWANLYAGALIGLRTAEQLGIDLATLAAKAAPPCLLLVYPFFHTSGLHTGLLATLARGARIVMMKRWSAEGALELIQRERVTQAPGVPTMLWDILKVSGRERFDLSSLASLGTGGQAMPVNLLADLRAAFPRAVFGNGYGLTEANGVVSLVVGDDFLARPATSGRPLPTVEMRFMLDETTPAAPGEPGEIWLKGAHLMREYFDDPLATHEVLRDGWLRTGDVGYLDGDGFLYICDRRKDMVISGGENIYCAEVERVLVEHPGVLEAGTFGIGDERLGEKLVAVVVPRDGSQVQEAELRSWVCDRLAAYKAPHRVWTSDAPLPRNALGKLDKIALRKAFAHAARS